MYYGTQFRPRVRASTIGTQRCSSSASEVLMMKLIKQTITI